MFLEEILLSDDVVKAVNDNLDYLLYIMPEISKMIGFPHNHPDHHLDVWNHTLLALSLSEKNFDVRLTLLLHDIGKPDHYQDEEIRHFRGHPEESVKIALPILKRLDFTPEYISYICYLIAHHDTPITEEDLNNNYGVTLKLYEVQRCDALAHHPDKLEKRKNYLNKTKEMILVKTKKLNGE